MNTELKQKWIEALRSGNYKQGTGKLRDGQDCYCCLGVLCDITGQAAWREPLGFDDSACYSFGGVEDYLPHSLSDSLGITARGEFTVTDELIDHLRSRLPAHRIEDLIDESYSDVSLADLNDNDWTFEEISHIIEFAKLNRY